MGIPKFYRWISERYPLISQHVDNNSIIPEYDNLYLDFNGIIHRCSHPNDVNPLNNQLTESEMILQMFNYVQRIVQQIKPKKVLIIAVDGVAPRAKMNQQRSRRFRSAKETEESLQRERNKGNIVPNQDQLFDSNCITPGTEFMEKLNRHFEYFIRKKISEDESWRHLNVLFSGHDVPGEGEHKIMSFIRKMKSQGANGNIEEYDSSFISFRNKIRNSNQEKNCLWDPNATHCMYGLDADLIMLSLVTHEPHFSLLRENSLHQIDPPKLTSIDSYDKRKKKSKKKTSDDFQLLHISILREYLNEEFKSSLSEDDNLKYDLERIIDDFVFMCYFIGNDFLPNLPFLDISDRALNRMFSMYKYNLKNFGDYLTDHGNINPISCQKFLEHVSIIEKEVLGVSEFNVEDNDNNELEEEEEKDVEENKSNTNKSSKKAVKELQQRLESLGITKQIIDKHRKTFHNLNPDDLWKQGYYLLKFKKSIEDNNFQDKLRFDYMQGLAWVLKYYYNGCQSYGWYYPYHYAPLASDLINFSKFKEITYFPPSEPFEPFQQLLGVLPIASKRLLPIEYQKLMTDSKSPLKSYYPLNFELDHNGKKNDWEAVVIIPFIDADILRNACDSIDKSKISDEEKFRNRLNGDNTWYYFDLKYKGFVKATLPGISDLNNTHTKKEILILPNYETNFKLCDGVLIGINAPSHFPTMKTLPFYSEEKMAKVTLFRMPSSKSSIIIHINKDTLWDTPKLNFKNNNNNNNNDDDNDEFFITEEEVLEKEIQFEQELAIEKNNAIDITQKIGKKLIGKNVYSNWPYHEESRVIEVCCQYINVKNNKVIPLDKNIWRKINSSLKKDFLTRKGIDIGELQIIVRVQPIMGMKQSNNGKLSKCFNNEESYWQPYQLIISNISNKDPRHKERSIPLHELYPLHSNIIITKKYFCGSFGKIIDHKESKSLCKIQFKKILKLPNIPQKYHNEFIDKYYSIDEIARKINFSNRIISQITGGIYGKKLSIDVGLNIKFSSRNEKIIGYSKRINGQWFFSEKAFDIICEYYKLFPEVFTAISNANSNSSNRDFQHTPSSLFPENTKQRFSELKKWIQSLKLSSLERISANEESMSELALTNTELFFNEFYEKNLKINNNDNDNLTSDWFHVNDLQGPITSQMIPNNNSSTFYVGDYVSYLRSSSGPLFGSVAIVISVNEYDGVLGLLFGEEFIGGCTLNGLCSSYSYLKDVEYRYCLRLYSPIYRSSNTQQSTNLQNSSSPQGFRILRSSGNKQNETRNVNDNRTNNNNNNNKSNNKNDSKTTSTDSKSKQNKKSSTNYNIKKNDGNLKQQNSPNILPGNEPHRILSQPPPSVNMNHQQIPTPNSSFQQFSNIIPQGINPILPPVQQLPNQMPLLTPSMINSGEPCQVPFGSMQYTHQPNPYYPYNQMGYMQYPPQAYQPFIPSQQINPSHNQNQNTKKRRHKRR